MVQGRWDTSIISCRFAALLLLQSPGQTPFELFQINSDWLAGRLSRFETPFELFQINSDWLAGRLSRFGSSSTL